MQKLDLAVDSIMYTILKVRNSVKFQAWPWRDTYPNYLLRLWPLHFGAIAKISVLLNISHSVWPNLPAYKPITISVHLHQQV